MNITFIEPKVGLCQICKKNVSVALFNTALVCESCINQKSVQQFIFGNIYDKFIRYLEHVRGKLIKYDDIDIHHADNNRAISGWLFTDSKQ